MGMPTKKVRISSLWCRVALHGAVVRCGLTIGALTLAPSAFAALGGPPTLESVSPQVTEQIKARAQQMILETSGASSAAIGAEGAWTVRESKLPGGTVEREYLGGDERVFAVAWRGPYRPGLSNLLGPTYAMQMSQRAFAQRKDGLGSRERTVQMSSTFCVRAISRQRFSAGVAWLPSRLPVGLHPDALSIPSSS
jgi:hypothetical protein